MDFENPEVRAELKELIALVRMDEKYTAVILDGVLPVDPLSIECHSQRISRIYEISNKYGLL